jgi:hypothetical protein
LKSDFVQGIQDKYSGYPAVLPQDYSFVYSDTFDTALDVTG